MLQQLRCCASRIAQCVGNIERKEDDEQAHGVLPVLAGC
jgi:hypothetical protein